MNNYIKPGDVHAPKRHWSLVQVLFDGGEDGSRNSRGNHSPSSLAIGRWDNKPVLAMRWNGNKQNPLGNPQSRGLPTWFVVPEEHWKQILETEHYEFSDDKVRFARDFLDLRRVYYRNRCPNPSCPDYQRPVLHKFKTSELGQVLEKLDQGEEIFWHFTCDFWWKPGQEEQSELRALLQSAWDRYLHASAP